MPQFPSALPRPLLSILAGAAVLTLVGCAQTTQHGYIPSEIALQQVPVGSSRDQVLIALGTPSTVGVLSRPKIPPARFSGPVCSPLIPIAVNTRHKCSSASVPRNEHPGLVTIEIGYAVNQTEDFSIAVLGLGSA